MKSIAWAIIIAATLMANPKNEAAERFMAAIFIVAVIGFIVSLPF